MNDVWKITVIEHCYFMEVGKGQTFYCEHQNKDADYPEDQPANVTILQGEGHNVLIDTGFSSEYFIEFTNSKYNLRPQEYLSEVGLTPDDIDTVIISHMHYDHIDHIDQFKNAQVFLQKDEFEWWKKISCLSDKYALLKCYLDKDTIPKLEKIDAEGRLHLIEDNTTVLPGIVVYKVPGHSFGDQCAVVSAKNGKYVICGDSAYTTANIEKMIPMGYGVSQYEMLCSFERIMGLADGDLSKIVPAHDLYWPETVPSTRCLEGKRNRITILE